MGYPKTHKLFQSYLKLYPLYYEYKSKLKYNDDLNLVPNIFLKNVHYFWFGSKPLPKLSNINEGHLGFTECKFKGSCPFF